MAGFTVQAMRPLRAVHPATDDRTRRELSTELRPTDRPQALHRGDLSTDTPRATQQPPSSASPACLTIRRRLSTDRDPVAPRPASALAIALAFAAIYFVWGSTYLAMHVAVRTLPPFLLAATRFLIAGGALFAWSVARGGAWPSRTAWRHAGVAGLLMLAGGNGGVVWAVQRVPSGIAALVVSTLPLWMVLLEWLSGGARPGLGVSAGIGLGLVGIVVLVGPDALATGGAQAVDPLRVGVLVLASLSWAAGSLYARAHKVPGPMTMAPALQMLVGGAALLTLSALTGEVGRFDPARASTASLLSMAYLIVFGSLVSYSAYVWLLGVVSPARVSTYAYVNPVVAMFLGAVLADEVLTARTIEAGAIIVGAVVLITTVTARKKAPASS